MAIADINEFFEQATDRAIELRGEVKNAASELEKLEDSAEEAEEHVREETGQVTTAIGWLIDRLGQAEEGIAKARREADAVLNELQQQATEVREGAEQLTSDVQEALGRLDGHQTKLEGDIDTRMQATSAKLQALGAAVAGVAEEVRDGHQEGVQALAEFGTTLTAAHDATQKSGEDTVKALESAVNEMATSADAWVDAMGELLTEQTTALMSLANGILDAHNASMTRLKTRIGDDVDKAAADPVDNLVQALQNLQDVADSHESLLTEEVKTILARVGAALPEMQRLAETLRTCSRLE